jgi:hypothetical protein
MHFVISPLPKEISCLPLQHLPVNEQLREKHLMMELDLGIHWLPQILMLGVFAMAVRSGWFLDEKHGTQVEDTVRGAISNVVQTFRLVGRQNPT